MGISSRQLAEMQARLAGRPGRAVTPQLEKSPLPAVILGLDPSLRGTGWGVLRTDGPQPRALAHGTIRCPSDWLRSRCLAVIARTLRDVIHEHHPEVCAVEGLFFAQNLKTALIMGEARGAALSAVADAAVPIHEIAPRRVKLAVVGYGAASKSAVAKMVQRLTSLAEVPEPDAADALALALAYVQEAGRPSLDPPARI